MSPTLSASVAAMPQLNALGIVSADLAESIRFYQLLGLELPQEEGHIETTLPNGVRFMLDSEDVIRSFRPDWSRATGNQLSLAFECESPVAVDETYRSIVDAGFAGEMEPFDAFWGQRYAQVRDPDGVSVDLFAAL